MTLRFNSMRPIQYVGLIVSFAVGSSLATPKASFKEKLFDAGTIQVGETILHEFLLKNDGDSTLHITEVRPTCHCTTPEYPTELEPGKEGKIVVKIVTADLPPQKLNKEVTIVTDDPVASRTVLSVSFNLTTAIEFIPTGLVYLYTKSGDDKDQDILVRPHVDGMKITSASSSNPAIQVRLEPVTVTGGQKPETGALANQFIQREGDVWVKIHLIGTAPVGTLAGDVTIRTNNPQHPEAVLKVRAKVEAAKSESAGAK